MIYKIPSNNAGERLDAYLAAAAELSRSAAAHFIEAGDVTVNGKRAAKNYRLATGDEVSLSLPAPVEPVALPENIPLDIVYEDEHLLVVNKPAGMVVHPAPGNFSGTLVNALLYHCGDSLSGINGVLRPGIVHRIDKETAGLLVVAKTDAAHKKLAADLEIHAIRREYRAVVRGNPKEDAGTVHKPIGRHPVDRKKMAVVADGRDAITHYTVLERFRGAAYLHLALETGRTHQIRVHMASEGYPLFFDATYGGGQSVMVYEGKLYATRTNRKDGQVFVMDQQGNWEQVTRKGGTVLCFDICGNTMVQAAMRGDKLAEIYVMNMETGAERQLGRRQPFLRLQYRGNAGYGVGQGYLLRLYGRSGA